MSKITRTGFALLLLLFLGSSAGNYAAASAKATAAKAQLKQNSPESQPARRGLDEGGSGTLQKMIVASGSVTMDIDLNRINGISSTTGKLETLHFGVAPNSFFPVLVFNNVFRGAEAGSIALVPQNNVALPAVLTASLNRLTIEKVHSGETFDMVVRDAMSGFVFFNIEANRHDYDASTQLLRIRGGRLLISETLADKLGRARQAGTQAGTISIDTAVTPIATTTIVNGKVESSILPPGNALIPGGHVRAPGPDIVVGDLTAMVQAGTSGTQVGLGIGTTSCNNGDQPVHFFALPQTDHSVVSQNFYRMSGGTNNNDRFEQIGQSWVKHTFAADQFDECNFGCTPWPDQTELGVGCSDPYDAGENAFYSLLGSRAWVNPFTGDFSSNAANHSGHTHTGTSHRVLVEISDLDTTQNTGATYYAEAEYDTPQEYAWCQAHPGQCNMYNNVSYRQFSVTGITHFTFCSTSVPVEPEPGIDGRAFAVYKVTNPSAGVWHYEYAIHNQNLDRSIQSFSVPLGTGVNVSNIEFHAPPNHPGFANDGTVGNAGFSNNPWVPNQTPSALMWTCETFAQNPNANAIRFGTLYNFRFDADQPPQSANATVGFFKTGSPMTVGIQSPGGGGTPTPTPTSSPTSTPTATATSTPTATPTPTSSPCSVSSPPCGTTFFTPPTVFNIDLSCPVDPATVQASDFTVNGIPADAFSLTNGNTRITFQYVSSPAVPGQNTMHIAAGAFNCCNGPVAEFTCTFIYEASTPTPTPTATAAATATSTSTPTPAATATATSTPTPTSTPRPTPTARPSPEPRARPTPAPRP